MQRQIRNAKINAKYITKYDINYFSFIQNILFLFEISLIYHQITLTKEEIVFAKSVVLAFNLNLGSSFIITGRKLPAISVLIDHKLLTKLAYSLCSPDNALT